MTITKTTKIKDQYEIICPKCGKLLTGVSIKAVRHNQRIHTVFCKKTHHTAPMPKNKGVQK